MRTREATLRRLRERLAKDDQTDSGRCGRDVEDSPILNGSVPERDVNESVTPSTPIAHPPNKAPACSAATPPSTQPVAVTAEKTHEDAALDSNDEEAEASLLNAYGQLRLCRTLGENLLGTKVVPLSETSWLVARVCLAYQAYNTPSHRSRFSHYLGQALDLYKWRLQRGQIHDDDMLVTGLLLCTVSISTLLLWTIHLSGLETMITERGPTAMQHDSLTVWVVEGAGLLDLPGATLGRRNPCRRIWSRLVAPLARGGIEPVSGLPRSLLDIIAKLGEGQNVKPQLLDWTPDVKAEHSLQYPFWEAFRLTILLAQHASREVSGSSDNVQSAETDSLVMRILSCVKMLRDTTDDSFQIPLRDCVLWPLFTAALHTDGGTSTRTLLTKEYQAFLDRRNKLVDRTAWSILQEVWARRDMNSTLHPLELANEFTYDMGIELHLY
ncbi:uncharacterized protein AB675_5301 [Cyphellophora attinorum]|uniref:Uncharacterized protein n=1 Tax=Cyphellophora attinorum TaxID=1664694 RepID=A0A0N1H6W0_9EURO|nr:uncharacterized protein AB675_5301 [Phialophora attinorum]KPI41935.1 hypothetical protein AB675_5301 [Phialophora attinorum]